VRGADEAVCGAAHLTLPGAIAPGPFPLPPEGRRGALVPNAEPTDDALSIEQSGHTTTDFGSSDGPAACGERVGVRGLFAAAQQLQMEKELAPHPEPALFAVSDLSPQAGRGD
jgi:hypothetical protein